MITVINRLIDVPSIDPEDARRRKLLNILLLGVGVLTLFTFFVAVLATLLGAAGQRWESIALVGATLAMLVGVVIIYAINHYRSGWLAGTLFLFLLVGVSAFADQPEALASGRSTFVFAVPVIIGSVLLKPYASFIIAAATGVILSALAFDVGIVPNVPAILGFFVIALVSWLSARSLERALDDLRVVNRELDQRVIERTHDLAQALNRVQAESSKNEAILESIADGVIVFDNEGKAIVANPALAEFTGQPVEQITGSDIATLTSERVHPSDREALISVVENKDLQRTGMRVQWGKKTLSVSFAAVRDSAGAELGNVMVFRDFTREAELERMKSAFVSTASHELRTPLNAILGYSDMLKEAVYGPLAEPQVETMNRIIANTRRMLSLVNNLLDQAQIEAGQLKLTPALFSVKDLADDLHSVMGILADQKGLQLDISSADDLPGGILSDAQRLHQILVNLVGNAIKFTDYGKVSVRFDRPDPSHWTIRVSDTGLGIPEEALAYIFEPFRQVDETVTRKHPGSGLGLAIVKQLVTLLGGEITVSSKLSQGSTFTIVLPLETAQEEVI
jgi:PAS domain S-box-containing protein